jgi:hypothetical protein
VLIMRCGMLMSEARAIRDGGAQAELLESSGSNWQQQLQRPLQIACRASAGTRVLAACYNWMTVGIYAEPCLVASGCRAVLYCCR